MQGVILLLALLGCCLAVPRPDFVAGGDHHHGEHHHGDHHHGDHHHEEHHHEEHDHDHHHEEDSAQLPPSSAKKCSLERSDNNDSGECFLEPECETVCSATTNKVQGFVMPIFYQSNSKMVSFIAGFVSALPSAVSSIPNFLLVFIQLAPHYWPC